MSTAAKADKPCQHGSRGEDCPDCEALCPALAAGYDRVNVLLYDAWEKLDSLRARIAELEGALNAVVNEPCSMLLSQAANLVRIVGPDHWPEDAIPRDSVVDMAMRVKDAADKQRSIARRALSPAPTPGDHKEPT